DRDWSTPIALAGHQPVAHAVAHRRLANASLFQRGNNLLDTLFRWQPRKWPGVYHDPGARKDVFRRLGQRATFHNLTDRQAVIPGKLKVPFVMGWDGHDGAG